MSKTNLKVKRPDKVVMKVIKRLKGANSIMELRDELLRVLTKTTEGKIDTRQAQAIARVASVIITSAKVQVEYKKLTGKPKKIGFLE